MAGNYYRTSHEVWLQYPTFHALSTASTTRLDHVTTVVLGVLIETVVELEMVVLHQMAALLERVVFHEMRVSLAMIVVLEFALPPQINLEVLPQPLCEGVYWAFSSS